MSPFTRRKGVTLAIAVVALASCADASPATTEPDPGTTTTAAPPTTRPWNPVTIDAAGESWEFPEEICEDSTEATAVLAAHAAFHAEEVRSLVARRASGWPTTTAPGPDGDAEFAAAIDHLGPETVTLGRRAGSIGEIEAAWERFEDRYADPVQGWGPVTEISSRLADWHETSSVIEEAILSRCGG